MEFEQKDWAGARSYADKIKVNADSIMTIFKDIDNTMNNLYGASWESSGALRAKERYDVIRKNYEEFYAIISAMKDHIYAVTEKSEEADKAASEEITNI